MATLITLLENQTSSDMLLQIHFRDHRLPNPAVVDFSAFTSSDPIEDFDFVCPFKFKRARGEGFCLTLQRACYLKICNCPQ